MMTMTMIADHHCQLMRARLVGVGEEEVGVAVLWDPVAATKAGVVSQTHRGLVIAVVTRGDSGGDEG